MKKLLFLLGLIGTMFSIMAFNPGDKKSVMHMSGAPAGYCGDPSGGNQNCTSCHTGASASNVNDWISSNIPVTGYVPGSTYQITATATSTGHSRFGFEISPQNTGGTLMGTMATVNSDAQVLSPGKYITHTSAGTSGTGSKTWIFNWTAPVINSGTITFYGAFNAANSSNTSDGDDIYLSRLTVSENMSTGGFTELLPGVKTFIVYPNPVSETMTVSYSVSALSSVELIIIDATGKRADRLISETRFPGIYTQTFDIKGKYPTGMYFIKLTTGKKSDVRKILVE
jgi:hypothetical protein